MSLVLGITLLLPLSIQWARNPSSSAGATEPTWQLLLVHVLHLTVHSAAHSLHSTQHTDAYQELLAVPKPAAAILTSQHKRKRFTGEPKNRQG